MAAVARIGIVVCVVVVLLGLVAYLGARVLRDEPADVLPAGARSAAPSSASPTRTTVAAAPGPTIRGIAGDLVYPCADPSEICEHLTTLRCSAGLRPDCRSAIGVLGEDVCQRLAMTNNRAEVRALGVACATGP